MERIVLDRATLAKLPNDKQVLIADEAGRVVGHFIPVMNGALPSSIQVPFTDEELDRAEREPGGRPLGDILANLSD